MTVANRITGAGHGDISGDLIGAAGLSQSFRRTDGDALRRQHSSFQEIRGRTHRVHDENPISSPPIKNGASNSETADQVVSTRLFQASVGGDPTPGSNQRTA